MSSFDALQAIGWPLSADAPAPEGASAPEAQWRELMAAHPQARPARVVE